MAAGHLAQGRSRGGHGPLVLGPRDSPPAAFTLSGHGLGPGIGMGQWGAFGYAVDYHEPYSWILQHYYANTTAGVVPNPLVSVAITGNAGFPIRVTSNTAFTVREGVSGPTIATIPANTALSMTLSDRAAGTWSLATGPSCTAKLWQPLSAGVPPTTTPVAVPAVGGPSATPAQVLDLCRGDGVVEPLRGEIEGVVHRGAPRTVNIVAMNSYLEGVVPSEAIAGWGLLGSPGPDGEPWGFQSLEAQAVAARSYADAFIASGGWHGYASICDSSECQAYGGMSAETPITDLAVTDTGDEVRLTSTGEVADTEYSASSGGYTAGGPYPAVPDLGDSVCYGGGTAYASCNPVHSWSATVTTSALEATFPSLGAITALTVTARNGLGAAGGRALSVEVVGSLSTTTLSGSAFAADFSLDSDWFVVTGSPPRSPPPPVPLPGLVGGDLVTKSGSLYRFGDAPEEGIHPEARIETPIVGIAATPDGKGYWLVSSTGGVYNYGDAAFYGSPADRHLETPIVGIAATPDGKGYWIVSSTGAVYNYGDAAFYGSPADRHLETPIVGIAATPDGKGYWIVSSTGAVYNYGDAAFYGSLARSHLDSPIVDIAATPSGLGYYLLGAGGRVTSFGAAPYRGSLVASSANQAVALLPAIGTAGYLVSSANGTLTPFGTVDLDNKVLRHPLLLGLPAGAVAVGLTGLSGSTRP